MPCTYEVGSTKWKYVCVVADEAAFERKMSRKKGYDCCLAQGLRQ